MKLKQIIEKHLHPIILIIATCFTCLVIFGTFIFGKKLIIFRDIGSDTFYSYYRFYYYLADLIHNLEFSFWSFKMGVGTSVLTLYAFLYDPFSLVYYIVGASNVSIAITYVFILKIFFAAYFAYLYFTYIKVGHFATVICSFLFAFNGYLMLWGQHYYFASVVIFLPFLLYSLERFMQEDKWLLLLVVIALLSLNIYIFYQMFIFVILYYIFRFYDRYGFDLNLFLRMTGKFIIIFLLAITSVAVLILPEYFILSSSPRVESKGLSGLLDFSFSFNTKEYYFSIFSRLFSNNLQGVGSYYKGFINYYESLQLFSSLLFLILLPQIFYLFNKKQKVIALTGILIAVAFITFPYFANMMNGFQYPAYRWGYNIIFSEILLIAFVLKAINEERKINLKLLFISSALVILSMLFINYQYISEAKIYESNLNKIIKITVILACYMLALFFLVKRGYRKGAVLTFMMFFLVLEMIEEHHDTFKKRGTVTKGLEIDKERVKNHSSIYLFGYTRDVVEYLESIDDRFYRIEKNRWIGSMNDSVVQGYNGLDTYNSLNTPSYTQFTQELNIPVIPGAPGTVHGWTSLQRPYLADLLSVKYYLTKDKKVKPENTVYLKTIGDIHIFKRKGALPFGVVFEEYVSPEKFFAISDEAKRNSILLKGFLPTEDLLLNEQFKGLTESSYDENVGRVSNLDRKREMTIESFKDDEIKGNITLTSKGMLFLSIPYAQGWRATVNEKQIDIQKINAGFSGLLLSRGYHQIKLKYIPPYFYEGLIVSLFSVIAIFGFFVRENKSRRIIRR
ncbi:MAG: YfhO family protein [Gammaproteobacteria bacterium]